MGRRWERWKVHSTVRGHGSPSRYPRRTKEILNTSCSAEQSRNLTEKGKERSHYVRTARAAACVPDSPSTRELPWFSEVPTYSKQFQKGESQPSHCSCTLCSFHPGRDFRGQALPWASLPCSARTPRDSIPRVTARCAQLWQKEGLECKAEKQTASESSLAQCRKERSHPREESPLAPGRGDPSPRLQLRSWAL